MPRIDRTTKLHQEFSRCVQLPAMQELLSDQEIDAICCDLRSYPLRSIAGRSLQPTDATRRVSEGICLLRSGSQGAAREGNGLAPRGFRAAISGGGEK